LYHLSILIDRAFERLVLRALTNHVIARQIVEKQQTRHIGHFKEKKIVELKKPPIKKDNK
jgi:hypothetical protein